jgi:molybdate transport system ATP-binding protein
MSCDIALQHSFGAFHIDANFQLVAPGVTALFGPSGAGKSTVINFLAGLMHPDEGRIVFDGETLLDTKRGIALSPGERRIGVVFQDARLFPHLSVETNLFYGWRRARTKTSGAEIDALIALLGLGALLRRRPGTLSGGEKSRVALARALLANPRALLLDEPLASLDAARKAEILPYLERLARETKVPLLYVSHSLDEVARLADRMVVLSEGRVKAEGSVFDVMARLDLFTGRGHLTPGAVLAATIEGHDDANALTMLTFSGGRLIVPHIARERGDQIRIRIDAQDVMLALAEPAAISANNVLPATIAAIRTGDDAYADVQLALGQACLVARITRRSLERLKLTPGGKVFAVIKSVTVGGKSHDG